MSASFKTTPEIPSGRLNPGVYPDFALLFALVMWAAIWWSAAWRSSARLPRGLGIRWPASATGFPTEVEEGEVATEMLTQQALGSSVSGAR